MSEDYSDLRFKREPRTDPILQDRAYGVYRGNDRLGSVFITPAGYWSTGYAGYRTHAATRYEAAVLVAQDYDRQNP